MKRFLPLLLLSLSACTSPTSPVHVADHSYHYAKFTAALRRPERFKVHLTSIKQVNDYVNTNVVWTPDAADYWQSLDETMSRKTGDCEDYAIAKRQLILQNDIDGAEDVELLLVWDYWKQANHAVLVVGSQVLDNQNKDIVDINSRDYTIRYKTLTIATP